MRAHNLNSSFVVIEEGERDVAPDWGELLLPFVGPEVWRIDVANVTRAVLFLQQWADEFFGPGKSALRQGVRGLKVGRPNQVLGSEPSSGNTESPVNHESSGVAKSPESLKSSPGIPAEHESSEEGKSLKSSSLPLEKTSTADWDGARVPGTNLLYCACGKKCKSGRQLGLWTYWCYQYVQFEKTSSGVLFKFRPLTVKDDPFESLQEGGLEFIVEDTTGRRDDVFTERDRTEPPNGAPPRLRARRCAYGWKVVPKENSERALLEKFKRDWAEVESK
eukprot:g29314.t1